MSNEIERWRKEGQAILAENEKHDTKWFDENDSYESIHEALSAMIGLALLGKPLANYRKAIFCARNTLKKYDESLNAKQSMPVIELPMEKYGYNFECSIYLSSEIIDALNKAGYPYKFKGE